MTTAGNTHGLPAPLWEMICALPQAPGVYLMKNRKQEVIYVGKAVSLRARVKSYFTGSDTRAFVALLERLLVDLETIVVRSEKEALLLEQTLIKDHQPRFNVIHRDDKSFITLMVNTRTQWPRVEVTRTHTLQQQGPKPGHRYFGPYSSAASVRQTLRLLNQHFMLRTCTDHVLANRTRPCLEYQIGRCMAPCVFDVPKEVYDEHVEDSLLFLAGRGDVLVDKLHDRMTAAAQATRFEEAARLRDQMRDVDRTMEKQVVSDSDGSDQDVLALARAGSLVALATVHIRRGRMTGKDVMLYPDAEIPDDELLLQVLDARYGTAEAAGIPDEVLLPLALPEDEVAAREEHLAEVRGKKVTLHAPQRGDKRRLVEIALTNAGNALDEHARKRETRHNALHRLQQRLHLQRRPTVMECFDISLFQGGQPVASQVVFEEGAPDRSRYRRYGIRDVTGTDDFAMMHEVITRRLVRGIKERSLPDVVVVDGGRGQLNAALAAFGDLGVPHTAALAQQLHDRVDTDGQPLWWDAGVWVEVCSLAKARALPAGSRKGYAGRRALVEEAAADVAVDEGGGDGGLAHSPERVFLPNVKDPVALRTNSAELHLMTAIRDEAHRFAITFHRQRRKRATLTSALESLPGVGPSRRKALLRHLGSMAAVKEASVEQLAGVPGISATLAQSIHQALRTQMPAPDSS